MLFDSAQFCSIFCLFYVYFILFIILCMFFFVYATHKKTELVWKIQPRFVFFFALEHSVSGSKFWISDQQFEKKVKNNYFASQMRFVFCFACCCCCCRLQPTDSDIDVSTISTYSQEWTKQVLTFFCFLFIFYINLIQLRYFRTDLQVFNLEKPLFHCFAICIFLSTLLRIPSSTPFATRDLQYVDVSDSISFSDFFFRSIASLSCGDWF